MMRRRSGLDRLIYRFQDRWETNRQFRAMVSGVLGLVMIVALCSCMGVVTTVANNAVASVNASRNVGVVDSQNADTGVGQIKGVPTFPTATVSAWQESGSPTVDVIPDSQTPIPSPTLAPTATAQPTVPCTGTCGGGGGGGGGSSFSATVSGSPTPATWTAGTAASFTVHSAPGGVFLAIVYTFPGGKTVLDENPNNKTDPTTGNYTSSFTVPSGVTSGQAKAWVQAFYNGVEKDFNFFVPCQP
jgi:hypothetical protein